MSRRIRVLVVDDSAVVRKVLASELAKHEDIEVVGTAMDPYVARDRIAALRPDVLTLDVNMPRMDGLLFLKHLMRHHPLPVVIVSHLAGEHSDVAARALQLGAVSIVPKPGTAYSTPDVHQMLVRAIRAAAESGDLQYRGQSAPRAAGRRGADAAADATGGLEGTAAPLADPARAAAPAGAAMPVPPAAAAGGSVSESGRGRRIVALGASTGGTRALEEIMRALPANSPGAVIVQHMPESFTASFAERLDRVAAMRVQEARDGDVVRPGLALVARGGQHLVLRRVGDEYVVRVHHGPPVHHQRPSVDVFFQSVAAAAGAEAVGVILTGMGSDGADGLLAMRNRGAYTLAQDEGSCAVYGMPKAAVSLGAVVQVAPLQRIARAIIGASTPLAPSP